MKSSMDFERWQPPVVTEEMLLAEQRRRQQRRRLVWLYATAMVYLAAALVCVGCLSTVSISMAAAGLAVICVIVSAGTLAAAVILSRRRDLIYECYRS